jgi:hypothetical protein
VILGIAGSAKIWSVIENTRILTSIDPVFGVTIQLLLIVVGIIEIVLAVGCALTVAGRYRFMVVAVFSTNLLMYRLCVWMSGMAEPCRCLGNLSDTLHLSSHLADNLMKAVLAYLLIGSYGRLIWHWRQTRMAMRATLQDTGEASSGA